MFLLSFIIAVNCISLIQGDCPEIISRKNWRSAYNLPTELLQTPVSTVFFHHTASAECTTRETCSNYMRIAQQYVAEEKDWDDMPYNFVIGGDGNIYEGRGWETVGAHTYGHNRDSISIAFVGDYLKKDPTPNMLEAAEILIDCGMEKGFIDANYGLYGQRDGSCGLGPGKHFYNTLKATWPHWHDHGELEQHCVFK